MTLNGSFRLTGQIQMMRFVQPLGYCLWEMNQMQTLVNTTNSFTVEKHRAYYTLASTILLLLF